MTLPAYSAGSIQKGLHSRICQEHERAPRKGVVRYRLRNLSLKPLLKRANRLLAEQAASLLPKRPLKIAIGYTLIPYHGKPKRKKDEVVMGKPKSGTTWFHAMRPRTPFSRAGE